MEQVMYSSLFRSSDAALEMELRAQDVAPQKVF